ncbi:hypothetical protein P378_20610 [Desulforamulus profundi]|uniref:Uncharacterized protein n=1 Tax=Desulforamulus profundi TaxID=1383067 RepID=A0A2C6MBR9_9FIRM|nr:hypothetical protein P378_20610 [Desulforamulus profundi]
MVKKFPACQFCQCSNCKSTGTCTGCATGVVHYKSKEQAEGVVWHRGNYKCSTVK